MGLGEGRPLRLLLVEDSSDDEEQVVWQLRGLTPRLVHRRVDDEATLRAALTSEPWDVVISDYVLPGFSGMDAIRVVREVQPDLPIIIVSGTVGEDVAVEAVRAGADDYVMKSNLDRLAYAISRTLRDVADRRERTVEQAALLAAERRLDGVLDAVPTAIMVVDQDGRIVRANRHMTRVFGYSQEEAIGLPVEALVPHGMREQHKGLREAYALHPDPRLMEEGREIEGVRKDGSPVRVEVGLALVEAGDETLTVAAAHDITARVELEARLHQAETMEALGRLAGGIAHDFNNLLTAINGYAELVALELPEGSSVRGEVDQIRSAGERGAELVRYLLAFGRRQALRPQVVDLREVLAGLEPLLRRLVTETIRVEVDVAYGTPAIHCDRSQLERSIVNLVVNARDAMPAGGTVALSARADDPSGFVALEISDTGTGIAPEILGQIFTPFFTTKSTGHGSGLGLASVHGFVAQSGGSIEVENRQSGGARFIVRLPVADIAGLEDLRGRTSAAERVQGHGETILVVEDDAAVRGIVELSLIRFGYRPVMADGPADVERALSAAGGDPAALVTDIVMPGMDGRTLARGLRARFPRLAVVLTSGYDPDGPNGREGASTTIPGAVFVAKPFEPAALAAAVAAVLAAPPAGGGRPSS